jgi:ATP-dependent Clp protease protease subunit
MATILLMAGKHRLIYPNSRVMMHQVSCSAAGDPRDIEITSNEIKRIRDQLTRAYIDCGVNRTAKQIDKDTAKEHWLSPADAVAYGIVDAIIQPEDWKRFISGEDM